MIHLVPAGQRFTQPSFSISSRGSWLPGAYDTARAANYAFRFPDAQLIALRDRICNSGERRPISWEDLKAHRQALKAA